MTVSIPPNAKKVFDGILFSVWQYPQRLFDGRTKTFELGARHDTVVVFPTQGDQILAGYEKQPHFEDFTLNFLGGMQDKHDDPLACAKAELLEEAGMVSDDWQLWSSYDVASKMDWKTSFYIARNVRKIAEQKLDPGGEIIEVRSFFFNSFVDMIVEGTIGKGDFRADILYRKLNGTLGEFEKALFGG